MDRHVFRLRLPGTGNPKRDLRAPNPGLCLEPVRPDAERSDAAPITELDPKTIRDTGTRPHDLGTKTTGLITPSAVCALHTPIRSLLSLRCVS